VGFLAGMARRGNRPLSRAGQQCPLNALITQLGRATPGAKAVVTQLMGQWQAEIVYSRTRLPSVTLAANMCVRGGVAASSHNRRCDISVITGMIMVTG
jgi:hypothetical protein